MFVLYNESISIVQSTIITKVTILETLKINRADFERYGVKNLGLFGSYARNEQKNESDIDILVEFKPNQQTYQNLMGLYDFIERLIPNKNIETVTRTELSPYIEPIILNEVEYV